MANLSQDGATPNNNNGASNELSSDHRQHDDTSFEVPESNIPTKAQGIIVDEDDPNVVHVCGFTIDLNIVTKEEIMSLRKILPQKEYRLLKNRKSARICRARRKTERTSMADELANLKRKYERLRRKVETVLPDYQSDNDSEDMCEH